MTTMHTNAGYLATGGERRRQDMLRYIGKFVDRSKYPPVPTLEKGVRRKKNKDKASRSG